jgi:hypothetical protein
MNLTKTKAQQLEQMRNWACDQQRDESQIERNQQLKQMKRYSCKKLIDEFLEAHYQKDVTNCSY